MSLIKIVATIGPATSSPEMLRALVEAGMNVARFNGAHGDLGWHSATMAALRSVAPDVPILLDLPGHKVRVGRLSADRSVASGDVVTLTNSGFGAGIPITDPRLPEEVAAGDLVLVNDGTVHLRVVRVDHADIVCTAENDGTIVSGKGISIRRSCRRKTTLTERDIVLLRFARDASVDFVGLSFTDSAEHVRAARRAIDGPRPAIIAKVETDDAFACLDEIVEEADAIMIDRGDLSIEAGMDDLMIRQKHVIDQARDRSKPVIVATELLQSMVTSRNPLKAEISDISNAVIDGAAALMLSAETAIGGFPLQAVSTMRRIADAVSQHVLVRLDGETRAGVKGIPHAIEDAIVSITRQIPISKIVAITRSGYAARVLSVRRPRPPILAVSDDPVAARSFNLFAGTRGIHVDIPFERTTTTHIVRCLEWLWRRGDLVDDDLVLVTSLAYPRSGNRMNLIETHKVADLVETLEWRR